MAEKKLTVAQKRDRDTAALIAEIQKDYEDKILILKSQHVTELATTATDNYLLGHEHGYDKAASVAKTQSFIDRLINKAL